MERRAQLEREGKVKGMQSVNRDEKLVEEILNSKNRDKIIDTIKSTIKDNPSYVDKDLAAAVRQAEKQIAMEKGLRLGYMRLLDNVTGNKLTRDFVEFEKDFFDLKNDIIFNGTKALNVVKNAYNKGKVKKLVDKTARFVSRVLSAPSKQLNGIKDEKKENPNREAQIGRMKKPL